MWSILATILGWGLSFFKPKPLDPTTTVERVDNAMLKDAANRPGSVADGIDRLP